MTARPENGPPAPYVGLRPFEFHEAALFYGRGEHIAEMVRTLRKSHFLAVVGSSGSGKSSLVRAGLLPAIDAGFMSGGEEAADWRFVIMRPGLDPYENLLHELLPQLAPEPVTRSGTHRVPPPDAPRRPARFGGSGRRLAAAGACATGRTGRSVRGDFPLSGTRRPQPTR